MKKIFSDSDDDFSDDASVSNRRLSNTMVLSKIQYDSNSLY